MGGLGNQLFQIATAAAHALEHGMDFFIIENDADFFAGQGSRPEKYYANIYEKIAKKPLPTDKKIMPYNERGFSYKDFNNLAASCKKHDMGLLIKGYFQSERYFEKHAALIKYLFTPTMGLENIIRQKTTIFQRFPELDPMSDKDGKKRCFLGVRRGDYVKNETMIQVHNPASLDYYKKAIQIMNADSYYVISDDIQWCKTHIPPLCPEAQFHFFEEADDLTTFYFARLFENYICANSSFHWWASYLSIHSKPTVIVPKEHFGPAGSQDYQDYFRTDMIRISNNPKDDTPEITICIPLYNGIEYLPETVSSIKAQTYTHWNCIIGVNGHGVTGGSVYEKAAALVAGDGRFRVVNYPEACCVADVDNAMAADAATDWIAHVDADDLWMARKLETQVAALNGPAAGADIIGTDCCYFGERNGKPAIKTGWLTAQDLMGSNHVINSSTLLRKSVAHYTNHFHGCEDYKLWLGSALVGRKIYNIPEILVAHRIHAQSNFNASNKQDPDAVRAFFSGSANTSASASAFTLVTAFYEMKSKFPSSTYLQWIHNFYSAYPGYMVIYTEEKYAAIFQSMRAPYADKTRIVCLPRSEWGAVKDVPASFWEAQYEMDHEKAHSPELYMIWYQKNDFVQRTIRENPFGHAKFMWCDSGVARTPVIQGWLAGMAVNGGSRILADKMTVLQINPFTAEERGSCTNVDPILDFTRNKDRIGGGILAGGITAWTLWNTHYKEMIVEFVKRGLFVGKDQNLFANMVLKHPRDVLVVPADRAVGHDNYWFYLLYYFGAPIKDFIQKHGI